MKNKEKSNGKKPDKKTKVKKEPIFKRLGKFTSKNYKAILIVWVVILAGAAYPALQLSKVISYNELEFLPDDLEYHEGSAILNDLFPSNSTGTTIIVMQSSELISSDDNIEYIRNLTERIFEEYGEDIAEFQSALTVFDEFNNSYWSMFNDAKNLLNTTIVDMIDTAVVSMHQTEEDLTILWDAISSIYTYTWFNLSRTYFYGNFNTTLFESGPSQSVYDIIHLLTNSTTGTGINPNFVNTVYSLFTSQLTNTSLVNDQVIQDFTQILANTTLFGYLNTTQGMTINEYNQEVYPYFDLYHTTWNETYYNMITGLGTTIVNGTIISENEFTNSSIINGYASQGNVLLQLLAVNNTVFNSLNITEIILDLTENSIDLLDLISDYTIDIPISQTDIINAINPLIPDFIEEIYLLGPSPTNEEINTLSESFLDQAFAEIMILFPPVENFDDPMIQDFMQWVISSDGKTSLILVRYDKFGKTLDEIDEMINTADNGIGDLAHQVKAELGLDQTEVYHTGDNFVTDVWTTQAQDDAKLIDIFTIVFVFIILLVFFASLVAPLIPLAVIGGSIVVSMAILFLISFGMDIHFMATLFLTVTSLGAGVDYCIFIFSRYNEERKNGFAKEQAIITSMTYAGESVFHSGLTVLVGFGAMIIPNFPLLRILGLAMIIGVTISITSALLVVPSIIMLLGDKIWWPKIFQKIFRPKTWFKKDEKTNEEDIEQLPEGTSVYSVKEKEENPEKKKSFLVRFANIITNNGLVITLITLAVSAPFIYFAFTMDTSTDFMGMLPSDFEGTEGRNILSDNMSVGDPTPIILLFYNLNESPISYDLRYETFTLTDNLDDIGHVSTIRTTIRPLGRVIINAHEGLFADICNSFVGEDNRSLLIEIYLDKSPYSKEAEEFVSNLPTTVENILADKNLEKLAIGDVYYLGYARSLYEIKQITDNAFPIVIPIVIVGVYLVLFFLFGSYFTPIRLILTIALGIVVTLGMLQLVFSVGLGVPIFWLLPLMLFSILMGLGLDYDIFLVTRIKEYYDKGMSNKEAIAHALDHTASIITSCGSVMAAAYSALLISQLWHLRELGFAFALAIILDATVIRLIVVPAVMVLMEKLNWIGPKWLMKKRHAAVENNSESKDADNSEK
ncbi:MAG: efflux RND transporter permease subunit [Candidatus Heimdallarchaeota archaeon]